jgi:hypothetical protein
MIERRHLRHRRRGGRSELAGGPQESTAPTSFRISPAPARAIRTRRSSGQGHDQAVLADGWKMRVSERPAKTWLFHLTEDPTEQHNVAETQPDEVRQLKALLAAHDAEQVPPAWPALVKFPVSIDKTLAEPESPDDEYVYWPN